MKLIDLSIPVKKNNSEPTSFEHNRLDSKTGATKVSGKGGFSSSAFPDSEFLTLDTYKLSTHTGTHVDAPLHFGASAESKNINTKSITELPLEWFLGDGIVLDFSKFPRKKNIEERDIKQKLINEKIKLKPFDIVLIRTDMSKEFEKKNYFTDGPGMGASATNYLISKGIKVMGIDSYGFDRSFPTMIEEYKQNGDKKVLWPSHFLGRRLEYVHIEKLKNLDLLPKSNFKLSLFPIKLESADASWVRAVAFIEE